MRERPFSRKYVAARNQSKISGELARISIENFPTPDRAVEYRIHRQRVIAKSDFDFSVNCRLFHPIKDR